MLTDKTSNQVPPKKVLIPRNPKQFNVSGIAHLTQNTSPNNIVIKCSSNSSQIINSNNQKLFLLKVTDNKKQPHYIRLPAVEAIKLINNQTSNLPDLKPQINLSTDEKVEKNKSPTHVLDHSYAANQNVNSISLNTKTQIKPTHIKTTNENSTSTKQSAQQTCNFINIGGQIKQITTQKNTIKQNVQQSCNFINVGGQVKQVTPQRSITKQNVRQSCNFINIGGQLKQITPQQTTEAVKKVYSEITPKPIFIKPVSPDVVNKPTQLGVQSDKVTITELRKQLSVKRTENMTLQKNLKRLQRESKTLIRKRLQDILKNVFSPTQIDKILNPHKAKVKWTVEDIISALTLQNISLKAYTYLRDNNYPLPGLSTIRKWTAQINLTEGLLKDVLVIMKFRTKSLSIFQKIVILHFDELCISNEICLIGIASGLFYKWMQPVYFSQKKTLSFSIIAEIVSQMFNAGFIVVALTCNLESKQMWRQLSVGIKSEEKCYILHPSKMNYKIYIFPNECHLLSLIRRQFLEYGFVISDKNINKQSVEQLTNINHKVEAIKFSKLTEGLLDELKYDDLKEATITKQLFSKEVAEKISFYIKKGYVSSDDFEKVADFFSTMNQWVKLFSIKSNENLNNAGEEVYGLDLENQNKTLDKINNLISSVKVEISKAPTVTSTSFQDQVILWVKSLKELLLFLQDCFSVEEFQIKYISTNKLSSECLNNVIGYLTSSDGANSKPQDLSEVTLAKFQTKLRKCILGKYLSDTISGHIWKILDPCLIDFNEKSDTTTSMNQLSQKETEDMEVTEDNL